MSTRGDNYFLLFNIILKIICLLIITRKYYKLKLYNKNILSSYIIVMKFGDSREISEITNVI